MKRFLPKLLFSLFVFSFLLLIVLRIPSLFEPKWYGDEGVYAAVAHHINNGAVLYKNIWENKPPLLLVFYTAFDRMPIDIQVAARGTALLLALATSVIFYFLTKTITRNSATAQIGCIILNVLLGMPMFENNIANAEPFFVFFTVSGIALVLSTNYTRLFFGGMLFSFAVLTKIPPIFEFFGVLFYLCIEAYTQKTTLRVMAKRIAVIFLGFIIPILCVCLVMAYYHAFQDFLFSSFAFGVTYVLNAYQRWILPNIILNSLTNRAALTAIVFLIAAGLRIKSRISNVAFFSILWLASSGFASFLSDRPYPHYLIQILPSFAFLSAAAITAKSRTWVKIVSVVIVGALILALFSNWHTFPRYNPGNYYQLFLDRYTGKLTEKEFNDAFDPQVNRSQKLDAWLKTNYPNAKTVLVYDNYPWQYVISNIYSPIRFTTQYHSFWQEWNRTKTMEDLHAHKPQLILIRSGIPLDSWFSDEYLNAYYSLKEEYEGYQFYLPKENLISP